LPDVSNLLFSSDCAAVYQLAGRFLSTFQYIFNQLDYNRSKNNYSKIYFGANRYGQRLPAVESTAEWPSPRREIGPAAYGLFFVNGQFSLFVDGSILASDGEGRVNPGDRNFPC